MIKKALLFFGMLLSILTVCAEDNVLQTIEIIPVKDTYNIVLTADKSVDVKKTVQAPNKITLDLKGIRASKTLNTIYNNVSNVDTVMVEPSGNGISIFFQAENAEGTSISFDSIAPVIPKTKQENNQVKLNSPIESYAPIYREDMAQEKTSALFNKLTKKSELMTEEIQDNLPETLNKVFSYGLIAFLVIAVARLFRRKEPDMKIGLSQSLNEREIDMYRSNQPIGVSYTNTEKPFTAINYGLNAYKKENQNPYESAPMPVSKPMVRSYSAPQKNLIQTAPQKSTATMTQNAVRKNTTPVLEEVSTKSNPNIDNLKFLESMTAIYEKSGRHDLAQGLKASLNKNKGQI